MFDRVEKLKKMLLDTTPEICVERAVIFTRVYEDNPALPCVEKRALALASVLREMTLYIEDGQLFAGNQAFKPRSAPIYPEYAYDFVLKEMDTFAGRESDRFTVSERDKEVLRQTLPKWSGRTLKDRALATQAEEVLDDIKTGVLGWSGNVSSGEGHIIPDYETALSLGLTGLLEQTDSLRARLDLADPADLRKLSFYRASDTILRGCIDYAKRCADFARELAENEKDAARKSELEGISERCSALAERAPKSFAEALQFVWLIHVILHIESNGHSISLGRLDQYLWPFLLTDLDNGSESLESAKLELECFFLKIYTNNKLRAWGTTRTQLGYPTYQNICLGGQTPDGTDATNQLSMLALDALTDVRLPEPNVYVRLHDGTPQAFLLRAVKTVKLGFGIPAFVNDKVIIPALMKRGVSREDAYNYSTMGCTEVQVPGKWGYRANGKSKINLLRILEIVLQGGVDKNTERVLFDGMRPLGECDSFEEIYQAYARALRYYMRLHVIADNINDTAMMQLTPDALCSILVQDCLERGKTIKEGGTVYDMMSGTLVGIPNVGNSLYALKKIVFDEKLVTPDELEQALESDFSGQKGRYIRNLLLNAAEKYGNDCDEVDFITRDSSDIFTREIGSYHTIRVGNEPIGCCYTSSTVTITANISCGASVGASPDGRAAGEPTADGVSPSRGTIQNGPTAMLKSVSKLSTELFTGGQLLNMRINPDCVRTERDELKFCQLLRGFADLRCWHTQFNFVNSDTLRAAQKDPASYSDLIVRVAGYSAQFISLNSEVQEDIIQRTEMGL